MKLAQWFWRRKILNFVNVFSLFVNYRRFGKGGALHLSKSWIPFTQECFVPNLVNIGPAVLEKIFFKFRQCIFAFGNNLPLETGGALHLNNWINLNPLLPRMFCARFGWNRSCSSWKEDENVKSLRQRQQRRRTTNFDQKNSLEL